MNWRRVAAAWFDAMGYLCTVLAEEVNPPPPRKPRVPKAKIAKPLWYPGDENH